MRKIFKKNDATVNADLVKKKFTRTIAITFLMIPLAIASTVLYMKNH